MSSTPVILEYVIESWQTGSPYKEQILEDGTYGMWSDIESVIDADGVTTKKLDEVRWQPYVTLSPERMTRLTEAIKNCGFFELAQAYKPENEVKDGGKVTWYAFIDGTTHSVEVWSGVVVPELENLKQARDMIAQEALDEANGETPRRASSVRMKHDEAGSYGTEVFEAEEPSNIVICVHGNGVRRWDGEGFFYEVAEQYPHDTFLLADQNQLYDDGCELNVLDVMAARVQRLIEQAKSDYPAVPIVVLAHSMGCGIVTYLDLSGVSKVVFVAPAAGDIARRLIERYGDDIQDGKVIRTDDGFTKYITKAYIDSIRGVEWEERYQDLLQRCAYVHVFEAEREEIVADERFTHREMPFASYQIIPGAMHNLKGEPLAWFFGEFSKLLQD